MEKSNNTNEQKRFIKIPSNLETIDGVHKEIPITLTEDGKPRAVAFFDIDKTLAELKAVHGETIRTLFTEIFPEANLEGIEDIYFKGFRLGNSFREFDRMNGIYNLNKTSWIDPETYIEERLKTRMKEIDSDGTDDHMIAKSYLDRYASMAAGIAEKMFKEHADEFEKSKIQPIFHLTKLYHALGIPMFGMTANGKDLVKVIAKYLNLSDIFVDIATDETMVGGGKEIAIPKLLEILEKKGIPVPKDRLVIVGDSLRGDIGSGDKFKNMQDGIQVKGILVLENKDALKETLSQINSNPELKKIVEGIDTEAFVVEDVPLDRDGSPLFFSRYRKDFLTKL